MPNPKSQTRLLLVITAFVVFSGIYLNTFYTLFFWVIPLIGPSYEWVFALLTVLSPFGAILIGRRLGASPLVTLLLSTAASGVAAAVLSPHAGVAWGLIVGILICFPEAETARLLFSLGRLGAAAVLGYVAFMLTRSVAIEFFTIWWICGLVALVAIILQLKLLRSPLPKRFDGRSQRSGFRAKAANVVLALATVVVLPSAWWLGWHAELDRRIGTIVAKRGQVKFREGKAAAAVLRSIRLGDWQFQGVRDLPFDPDWLSKAVRELLDRPPAVLVKLKDATVHDVRTLTALYGIRSLEIDGGAVDDSALSQLVLPDARSLAITKTQITAAFLADHKFLPQLNHISAQASPLSDATMAHLANRPKLNRVLLHGTEVTPAGLMQLKQLPEWPNVSTDVPMGESVPMLVELLEDDRAPAREWAVRALSGIEPPMHAKTVPLIAACLDDEDSEVSRSAVQALTRIRTPEAVAAVVPPLIACLERFDQDAWRALRSLKSLGQDATDAIPALLRLLEADGRWSHNAFDLLLRMGTPEVIRSVEEIVVRQLAAAREAEWMVGGEPSERLQYLASRLATLRIRGEVGDDYYGQYRYDLEGEPSEVVLRYEKLVAAQRRFLEPGDSSTLRTLVRLADLYCTLQQAEPAEKYLEEYLDSVLNSQRRNFSMRTRGEVEVLALRCLSLRGAKAPQSWQYYDTQRLLGLATVATQRLDAAEARLVEAYRELVARQETIPQTVRGERLAASATALSQLYARWGQAALAAKWKQTAQRHERELSR